MIRPPLDFLEYPGVLSQKQLYNRCHSGLDKPAPYLIRGNPIFETGFPPGQGPYGPAARFCGNDGLWITVKYC